ncbi:SET domain-containing protein [Trametes coccinea BRFM310]|uniref:SET domain-containing protein n=1 Tax=Trametes coccinea (strain BRFM310) TaxID=1353009 RepID=A0A1Y2ISS6_TRAC3|nr:SET domain-containing protein [Trametes coccinea BRFM310]
MSEQEPQNVAAFKAWLVQNGARIHPDVLFEPVASGFNVVAGSDVPADTTVVSIPFSLAITPALSRSALGTLFANAGATVPELNELSERQLVCTYLCMHWIAESSNSQGALQHGPYINTLPSPEKLRTPLHFTPAEVDAFRGSNLYGATLDRRRDWEVEWEQCKTVVNAANPSWAAAFTWERYLTASTYLSSRAFPSTVLSESPTLVTTASSYPVLLPGIDALNHARGHSVSWVVSSPSASSPTSAEPSISLVIHAPTPRGAELLNNYGPKPNSELILGYGFSLPNNPDDTIVLKIGGPSAASASSSQGGSASSPGKWEVGRGARGAEPVWEAVLAAVRAQGGDEEDEDEEGDAIEDELCAADMLAEMAQSLYDRLPPFPPANKAEMRPEVVEMLGHYLEGQRNILQSLVSFARDKEAQALQRAREEGLDIVDEEDEEAED